MESCRRPFFRINRQEIYFSTIFSCASSEVLWQLEEKHFPFGKLGKSEVVEKQMREKLAHHYFIFSPNNRNWQRGKKKEPQKSSVHNMYRYIWIPIAIRPLKVADVELLLIFASIFNSYKRGFNSSARYKISAIVSYIVLCFTVRHCGLFFFGFFICYFSGAWPAIGLWRWKVVQYRNPGQTCHTGRGHKLTHALWVAEHNDLAFAAIALQLKATFKTHSPFHPTNRSAAGAELYWFYWVVV